MKTIRIPSIIDITGKSSIIIEAIIKRKCNMNILKNIKDIYIKLSQNQKTKYANHLPQSWSAKNF